MEILRGDTDQWIRRSDQEIAASGWPSLAVSKAEFGQVVVDQVAGGGFEPEPGPQPRRLDVGAVSGLLHPGPRRIVGPAPAVFGVDGVAQRTEGLLPAGRRDVEAPPRSRCNTAAQA